VRRISQQGSLKWRGERTFISEIFAYEWLGLKTLDERYCEVLYGPVVVGFFDAHQHPVSPRLEPPAEAPTGARRELRACGNAGRWKARKIQKAGFPAFPPPLEIAAAIPTFPHARRLAL